MTLCVNSLSNLEGHGFFVVGRQSIQDGGKRDRGLMKIAVQDQDPLAAVMDQISRDFDQILWVKDLPILQLQIAPDHVKALGANERVQGLVRAFTGKSE